MPAPPYGPVPPYQQAPPPAPPAPAAPPDWWRAVAVGLLNLSGLGLGYVLTRAWRMAVLCWAATGVLLLVALPATPSGIPTGVVVLYTAFLVLVGVLGAIRGLRTPLVWPPRPLIAFGLAVVLLAVPLLGAQAYDSARQNAIQTMLMNRLTQADATLTAAETEPLATAEPGFVTGLGAYQDLLDHHATSRAAKLVPQRLKVFYGAVSQPYTNGDYCGAIAPLKFLRTVPSTAISARDLGSLVTYPDDPLATSLYQCGLTTLKPDGDSTAVQDFNDLMATFPTSPQAGKVEPAVANAITSTASGLTGPDPCTAVSQLALLGGQVGKLTSGVAGITTALQKDVVTVNNGVETGTFDCAVSKYKAGNFTDAQTSMDNFATTYPNDPNTPLAQKYSIAAQVAQQSAAAGKVVPNLTSGGSVSITIFNDGPAAVHILYTGPATGTVDIGACSSCKVYASTTDGQQNACSDSSVNYPKTTFTLPPGTTYFLQKSTDTNVTPYSHTEQYDADTTYAVCAFETRPFSNPLAG